MLISLIPCAIACWARCIGPAEAAVAACVFAPCIAAVGLCSSGSEGEADLQEQRGSLAAELSWNLASETLGAPARQPDTDAPAQSRHGLIAAPREDERPALRVEGSTRLVP